MISEATLFVRAFVSHENPPQIQDMPYAERMALAGYEILELVTRVKRGKWIQKRRAD
jgi:hypothetical protein